MSMTTLDGIFEDFEFLDDWEDRYRYLIDLGKELSPYPDQLRDSNHKVHGCASQVWLATSAGNGENPVITFMGDSDAHIVRGLVALVLIIYSGKRATEIMTVDPKAILEKLGLDEHLSSQRANGLRSMIERIRHEAKAYL